MKNYDNCYINWRHVFLRAICASTKFYQCMLKTEKKKNSSTFYYYKKKQDKYR